MILNNFMRQATTEKAKFISVSFICSSYMFILFFVVAGI